MDQALRLQEREDSAQGTVLTSWLHRLRTGQLVPELVEVEDKHRFLQRALRLSERIGEELALLLLPRWATTRFRNPTTRPLDLPEGAYTTRTVRPDYFGQADLESVLPEDAPSDLLQGYPVASLLDSPGVVFAPYIPLYTTPITNRHPDDKFWNHPPDDPCKAWAHFFKIIPMKQLLLFLQEQVKRNEDASPVFKAFVSPRRLLIYHKRLKLNLENGAPYLTDHHADFDMLLLPKLDSPDFPNTCSDLHNAHHFLSNACDTTSALSSQQAGVIATLRSLTKFDLDIDEEYTQRNNLADLLTHTHPPTPLMRRSHIAPQR